MNLKMLLLFRICILTVCQMQNLWSAWRSKGQSFRVGIELGLWRIKPPASEGIGIFTWKMPSVCSSVLILKLNLFALLGYRCQMICWSRPRLLLRQLLRKWTLTKELRAQSELILSSGGAVEIFDPFGLTDWTWPICRILFQCPVNFIRT